MITLKTKEDISILREGGKRHANIMKELARHVAPGVEASFLDKLAFDLISKEGDKPAFLLYKPYGAKRPYPASLCVSINDEVVHGIPNEGKKILNEGDIVSLDLGLIHRGLITDMAITLPVGKVDERSKKLLEVTRNALSIGIKAARGGARVGDVGFAIQSVIDKEGFGIVRELAGHGVGYKVHEDPYVPNFGEKGKGEKLIPGMVIAIEPMVNLGGDDVYLEKDGYTYRTKDRERSAHFEHTILVTEGEAEVLTS